MSGAVGNAASAGLVNCGLCDRGFRRKDGDHLPSQRLGMIAVTPCARVFAVHVGQATADNKRPWLAYVDNKPLVNANGVPRRFAASRAAVTAARKAAQ